MHTSQRFVRLILIWSTLASGTMLAGCTTTPSFSESDAALKHSGVIATSDAYPGSARVAVRWTQEVTPAAQDVIKPRWLTNFSNAVFGRDVSQEILRDKLPTSYASIPVGSLYYAAEFARLLARHIPSQDIVLEPLVLDAKDGKLFYRPLVRNRFPVLTVVNLWDAPPTFSSGMTGWSVVISSAATAGLASPATCGVLLVRPARNLMPSYDASSCPSLESRDTPIPDIVYGFEEQPHDFKMGIPIKSSLPVSPGTAVLLPQAYENFTPAYFKASAADGFDAKKSIENPALENIAKVVADGLARLDPALATQVAFARYVALYDPALSQRWSAHELADGDQARLAVITKLAEAERKWVSAEDGRMVERVLDGSFGKSFRANRLAANTHFERQQAMAWASALSMASAAAVSGTFTGGVGNMQLGNSMAMQAFSNYYASTDQANNSFFEQFGDEISARNQFVSIELSGKLIKLNASNRQKLAEETLAIYRSQFPASKLADRTAGTSSKASTSSKRKK